MDRATSSDVSSDSGKNKVNDRLKRLRELKIRRIESKKLNHEEVVEEDRRGKLPKNWENRQMRAEYKLNEIQARKECSAAGRDYDREKLLNVSAADAQRKDVAKKRKKDPDMGFSSEFLCCYKIFCVRPVSYYQGSHVFVNKKFPTFSIPQFAQIN